MSKKLTKSEQEFLVSLITDKIVSERNSKLKEHIQNDPKYLEFKKRVEEVQSLSLQLDEDCKKLDKQFCEKLGMDSSKWDDRSLILNCNYNVEVKIGSVSSYSVKRQVEQKVMYEQVVLGGISEDFINRIVSELS